MSKILRLLTVSLLLASIMIATVGSSTVFAAWNGDDTGNWDVNGDPDRLRDGSCDTCDGDGPP
ncbi:hypothetical protein ACFLUU_10110 [Chloroflexota bacterium]